VYGSETRALATLEVLAGLRTPAVIPAYVLIRVEFDEGLTTALDVRTLPKAWKDSPPGDPTQRLGNEWLKAGASVALRVPSAVVPNEFNYLLNPSHPDFKKVRVGKPEALYLDPRILPG
jgi:RES domain-containing protein